VTDSAQSAWETFRQDKEVRFGCRRWLAVNKLAAIIGSSLALVAGMPAQAAPQDIRFVVNQYSMYYPGDVRNPELRLEVPQGGQLFFINADTVTGLQGWGAHTITEEVPFGSTQVPRFASPLLEPGGYAEVEGISDLPAGEYLFFCESHGPVMRGTLFIT
jgi:hypothetical protein